MLLGLPSQMGIKVNLDLTKYISFNLSSTTYHLHYSPMLQTYDLKNGNFRICSEDITEYYKDSKSSIKKEIANYCFTEDKIYVAYMSKSIFYSLRVGVYEHQSKLLREKWHSTTQQNSYKKLNIG